MCEKNCDQFGNQIFLTKTAEVLVLCCIDFRLFNKYTDFLDSIGLCKQYDQYVCVGASLGILTNKLYSDVFLDHVDIAINFHKIKSIYCFDHEQCKAYELYYSEMTKDEEYNLHIKRLKEFRQYINNNYENMNVKTFYMDICGNAEEII